MTFKYNSHPIIPTNLQIVTALAAALSRVEVIAFVLSHPEVNGFQVVLCFILCQNRRYEDIVSNRGFVLNDIFDWVVPVTLLNEITGQGLHDAVPGLWMRKCCYWKINEFVNK